MKRKALIVMFILVAISDAFCGISVSTKKAAHVYTCFIGVNNFRNDNLPKLNYCVQDACSVFKEMTTGPDENNQLFVDKDATRENILGFFSGVLMKSKKDDMIILYVATHGIIAYNDFFFIPYDGDASNLLGTCIPASILINAFSSKIKEGVSILVILDTCHSASMGFDITKMYNEAQASGIGLLYSASVVEPAEEGPQYGGGHGVFSYYLSEGLKGKADLNKDNEITIRKLFDYVYANVKSATEDMQNPVYIGTLDNNVVIRRIKK